MSSSLGPRAAATEVAAAAAAATAAAAAAARPPPPPPPRTAATAAAAAATAALAAGDRRRGTARCWRRSRSCTSSRPSSCRPTSASAGDPRRRPASLVEVLRAVLALLAPDDDAVPLGALLLLLVLVGEDLVGGDAQLAHRLPRRQILQLGLGAEVADQDHLVHAAAMVPPMKTQHAFALRIGQVFSERENLLRFLRSCFASCASPW